MHVMKPKVIVVLGIMGAIPVAGVAWQTIHYLIGLRRLGYDVYYIEATGVWPYNTETDDCTFPVNYIHTLMSRFDFADRWAYCAAHSDDRCYGMTALQVKALYARADAILNLSGGTVLRDEHKVCQKRIYLETDPVICQIGIVAGHLSTIESLSAHTDHLSYGENYGKADCRVPIERFSYYPTRQPIVLDFWENVSNPTSERFTTIAHWDQSGKDMLYDGERYSWSKHQEFVKYLLLPERTGQEFTLALAIDDPKTIEATLELLRRHGWFVDDALRLSADIDTYRKYIWQSRGEFTVAKDMNVRLRSGWFSDRSASYLAAGKPVVTQETGFSKYLPTGRGLFAFDCFDEAAAAIDMINTDYQQHSRAARAIAEDYFDANKVLRQLTTNVGLA
jgi:hypothetical protein